MSVISRCVSKEGFVVVVDALDALLGGCAWKYKKKKKQQGGVHI